MSTNRQLFDSNVACCLHNATRKFTGVSDLANIYWTITLCTQQIQIFKSITSSGVFFSVLQHFCTANLGEVSSALLGLQMSLALVGCELCWSLVGYELLYPALGLTRGYLVEGLISSAAMQRISSFRENTSLAQTVRYK